MDGRELLELAAKAAGYVIDDWNGEYPVFYVEHWNGNPNEPPQQEIVYWNPLTDDGDALRLAVELSLMLDIYSGVVVGHDHKLALNITDAWHERDSCDSPGAACSELHGDDSFAATRRAIVCAAAEIGRHL